METIYLSPHLDDAALSCGGLIWQQVQAGQQVQVWTICAGEPPSGALSVFAQVLHKRWGLKPECAVAERRREDLRAMQILGAKIQHLSFPDAVYRRHPKTNEVLYESWETVIGGMAPGDEHLLQRVVVELSKLLPQNAALIAPLTLGNHVDHVLTRVAAEQLPRPVSFYLDFPYVEKAAGEIPSLVPQGFQRTLHPVSELGLTAWQDGVAAYRSQLSTFWSSEMEMRQAIARHNQQYGGITLWKPTR